MQPRYSNWCTHVELIEIHSNNSHTAYFASCFTEMIIAHHLVKGNVFCLLFLVSFVQWYVYAYWCKSGNFWTLKFIILSLHLLVISSFPLEWEISSIQCCLLLHIVKSNYKISDRILFVFVNVFFVMLPVLLVYLLLGCITCIAWEHGLLM